MSQQEASISKLLFVSTSKIYSKFFCCIVFWIKTPTMWDFISQRKKVILEIFVLSLSKNHSAQNSLLPVQKKLFKIISIFKSWIDNHNWFFLSLLFPLFLLKNKKTYFFTLFSNFFLTIKKMDMILCYVVHYESFVTLLSLSLITKVYTP